MPPKRPTRRPTRRPKPASGGGVAENRSALKIMRGLKGPNDKYIQTTLPNGVAAAQPTLTVPIVQCLNAVAPGTSENQRIGRLAKMKWLDLNLHAYLNNAAITVMSRFYIVVETTALGSNLAPSQFLLDSSNFSPLSQRDRTNRDASRFCVLYDSKPFIIGGTSAASGQTAPVVTGSGQPAERAWALHLPLNFSTDYSRNTGGTIADIDTNAMSLLFVTDAASAGITVDATWTVAFNDDS